jgi:16S rRNA processing protein RimM
MSGNDNRLCMGVIVGARGLKGDLRIKSFTDTATDICAYGPVTTDDGTELKLKVTGEAKGVVIGRVAGVDDRTKADALKGQKLYVARNALPDTEDKDEFYHADLLGLSVMDETGKECGTVNAIYDFGGGDIIDVRLPDSRTLMVPFTADSVPKVDLKAGKLVVLASALAAAEGEPPLLEPEEPTEELLTSQDSAS